MKGKKEFTFLGELSPLYCYIFTTAHHWIHIEVVEKSFSTFLYIFCGMQV